ncbi:FecR family protein [Bacteroides sp. 224]|uniref:FecR family protein n=1 Tax=Bacteroides sp. 224 TaxID=2302936 RepID=UPI0013D573DC|nr:FecR domain-containing protein [Bacteroides sp. 224]NDV64030.1 DUF4974 domain-containing protein [Bacteroides sp. 224]
MKEETPYEQITHYLSDDFTPDVEQALRKVNRRIDDKQKKRPKRIFAWVSAAAVAAILIISIVTVWNRNTPDEIPVALFLALHTNTSETLEYALPDGSKVVLNHSSTLQYPEVFTGEAREIYLEGEAFFDIAPNANQPFIIHAKGTQTRVVGTSFSIKALQTEEEVVVTVATGIVNLMTEKKPDYIELKKGEQGICRLTEQKLEKNEHPDPNALAWKTKRLVFKQTPLKEAVRVIENAYQTSISVDSAIAELQLTSTFEQLSLEDILQIIEITLQIRIDRTSKGIYLSSAKVYT